MKTLEELKEQPLKYPVEKYARWCYRKDQYDYPSFLIAITFSAVARGFFAYGDIDPEWETLWEGIKAQREGFKAGQDYDEHFCYMILDQAFQLEYEDDLLETGFFDRLPD